MTPLDGDAVGHVVLGFDPGWRMNNLLRMAAGEAAHREATLAIVMVARPEDEADFSMTGRSAARREAEASARQRLARAAESVHTLHEHLAVTTHYLTEDQAQQARHPLSGAQLLVVATVGQTGRRAFGLESVSRILLKATRCPVLVVPDDDPVIARVQHRDAVVAGIGDHASDAVVLQSAGAESVRHRCGLEILHAYRDLGAEPPDQAFRRAADVVSAAIAAAGTAPGQGASVLLTHDDPATALARQASGARMLVIGSRPGSLSGLVLGSVGREILNSLRCPLLVIPDPAPVFAAGIGTF